MSGGPNNWFQESEFERERKWHVREDRETIPSNHLCDIITKPIISWIPLSRSREGAKWNVISPWGKEWISPFLLWSPFLAIVHHIQMIIILMRRKIKFNWFSFIMIHNENRSLWKHKRGRIHRHNDIGWRRQDSDLVGIPFDSLRAAGWDELNSRAVCPVIRSFLDCRPVLSLIEWQDQEKIIQFSIINLHPDVFILRLFCLKLEFFVRLRSCDHFLFSPGRA